MFMGFSTSVCGGDQEVYKYFSMLVAWYSFE